MTFAQLRKTNRRGRRRGALAVEAALLWPALFIACLPGIEIARIFHTTALVGNSARNAALCWADPRVARQLRCLNEETRVVDIRKAALIGVEHLEDGLTVSWDVDEDETTQADFVRVTVELHYEPVIPLPNFSPRISRTAWMKRLPLPPFGA